MGIQKILELNWDMGLSRNGNDGHTHTQFCFSWGILLKHQQLSNFFPIFLAVFPPLEAQFQPFTPQPLAVCAAQEAPVTPPVPLYGRVTAVHPFRIPNSTAEVNLRSPGVVVVACCGARLTGAFYAGNGWVAGGCWDDY